MKLPVTLMIAALAIPSSGASAQYVQDVAHYQTTRVDGLGAGDRHQNIATDSLWRIRALALRHEALELQQRDGGTLTSEHRAMLQAKLDRINGQARQH